MVAKRKVKRLRFGGRVFATILGVLLLFGAVGTGRLVTPNLSFLQTNIKATSNACVKQFSTTTTGTVGCCSLTGANSVYTSCNTASDPWCNAYPCSGDGCCSNAEDACNYFGRSWCDSDWPSLTKTCCEVGWVCRNDMAGCTPSTIPPTDPGTLEFIPPNLTVNVGQTFYDLRARPVGSPPIRRVTFTTDYPEYISIDPPEDTEQGNQFLTNVTGVQPGTSIPITARSYNASDQFLAEVTGYVTVLTTNTLTITPNTKTVNRFATSTSPFTARYTGTAPNHVHFSSGDVTKFTVVTASDNSFPYKTNVSGVGVTTGTLITAISHTVSHVELARDTATVVVPTPTITLSPNAKNVIIGQTITNAFTASTTGPAPNHVVFTPATGGYFTVNPTTDTPSNGFKTSVTGVRLGTNILITARSYYTNNNTVLLASDTATVTVSSPSWWQVLNSDIQTKGSLTSSVPAVANAYFSALTSGWIGPGVVAYPPGYTANIPTGKVSVKGWLANSSATNPKTFNYAYFAGQIPADVIPTVIATRTPAATVFTSGGTLKYGYYWYIYNGNAAAAQTLTIPTVNLGTRRIILLVPNARVTIGGNINLNDGAGFFMITAKNNITVANSIGGTGTTPHLEGIYITDGTFNAGTAATPLYIRGSVVGNTAVTMTGRTYNAVAAPAIRYQYAPDQIWLFPGKLGARKINWNEVAP